MLSFISTSKWEETIEVAKRTRSADLVPVYWALNTSRILLGMCSGNNRPDVNYIQSEEMGIVSIDANPFDTSQDRLVVICYPDLSQSALLLIMLTQFDTKYADMEYAKRSVMAYLN